MKKIFAILLALVLVLAMGIPAMAATITIDPNVPTGAISNNTYTAYQIFAATIDGDKVSYTIDSSSPFYAAVNSSGYFTLTQVGTTETYIVEAKAEFTSDAAKTLAAALEAVVKDKSLTGTEANYDEATKKYQISVSEDGYYLITSSVGSALVLDTFKNDTVTEKNSYPTIDKVVNNATADMGSTVTYTITVGIPANAVGEIVVHDNMTGLAYSTLDSVKVDGADIGGVTAVTAGLGDDCEVHFVLSADCVAANLGKSVVITYSAVVTANTANNEAYLENGTYDSTTDTVEVKNYSLPVFKYTGSGDTKTGLAGAGFVLTKTVDGATKYYKYTAATETTPAKVEWVDSEGEATELKTATDAYTVNFTGLAAGTYTIVEKTVPTGYNPAQPVTVVIADDGKITQEGTEIEKVAIQNNTGSELPSTGGIGTTIFYVVGGLLMAAAVVLLVTKKKVSSK